jgi:Flagellar hook-length control protein FliK
MRGRPAEFWRRDDGPVTEGLGQAAPAPSTARFVTEIVHKELGAMAVAVERSGDAVRVVFEVADAVARVALETQRASLLDALHTSGVRVASVVVVVRSGGIPLAQGPRKPKGRSEDDAKNLDLVG